MKKIKIMATTAMIAMVTTAGYFGYTAYEYANMTDAERMMLANLEALTQSGESDIWYAGYTEGEATFNDVTIPCCVPSSQNNACNYDSVGCITTM